MTITETLAAGLTRSDAEELFSREARLLDEWRLNDWLDLLTDDVRYEIPSTDQPNASAATSLFLVADDRRRLESRVGQLLGPSAWAENPRSRTRRLITNVEVLGEGRDGSEIGANFAVWRFRNDLTDVYVGHYRYRVVRQHGALRIRYRRAVLDLESLRPHGKVSFIL